MINENEIITDKNCKIVYKWGSQIQQALNSILIQLF